MPVDAKNSRDFFSAFLEFVPEFCKTEKNEPNFATFLVISTVHILLNVLDDFHVCLFHFFAGAVFHEKGGYILDYTQMIFFNIRTFKTTW